MRRRLYIICAVYLFLSAGCTNLPWSGKTNDLAQQTEALLRQNNPERLIQESSASGEQSRQEHLMFAVSLIKNNKAQEAEAHLNAINLNGLSTENLIKVNLIYAQINLSYAKAEQALQHLELIPPAQLLAEDKVAYYQASAFALSLTKQFVESAKARMELTQLLKDKKQQLSNNTAILDTLRLLPIQSLKAQRHLTAGDASGWMALAALYKEKPSLSARDPALASWRKEFPKHPANTEFFKQYAVALQKALPTIAVFLPNSGSFAEAGKAIEKGIAVAHEKSSAQVAKPKLRYYDSSASDSVALYRKAINEGAQLIIGPLNKEHVEELANKANLTVPVLALNYVPGVNKSNLYQFALSPIDDAVSLVHKAVQDGHKRLVVLTPTSDLGNRMQAYFKTAIANEGATLIKAGSYNPESTDLSVAVRNLFNSEGEQRLGQLKKLLPTLQADTRSRQDVDAVLLVAYPPNAKALQTQLNKMTATALPIYASSQIYNGIASANDLNLDGIQFCDIPWLFANSYPGELSQEALRPKWQDLPNIYLRLIAMGIDAYNLVGYLDQLNTVAYQGATGKLQLGSDNRIQRELVCGQFNQQKALVDSD